MDKLELFEDFNELYEIESNIEYLVEKESLKDSQEKGFKRTMIIVGGWLTAIFILPFFGLPALIGILEILIVVGLGSLVVKLVKYLKSNNETKEKIKKTSNIKQREKLVEEVYTNENKIKNYLKSIKKQEEQLKTKVNKIGTKNKDNKVLTEFVDEVCKTEAHDKASKQWEQTYRNYCKQHNVEESDELNKDAKKVADKLYDEIYQKTYKEQYEKNIKNVK